MFWVRSNNDEFIKKSMIINGDKFEYSKLNYISAKTKVIITCRIHGDFTVVPTNHLKGRGCPKCGIINRVNSSRKSNIDLISQCKEIWGDRFDYSEVEYMGAKYKCKIICNTCGSTFMQTMDTHLNSKNNGCPNCKSTRGWSRSQWVDFCNKKKNCTPTVYIVRLFNNDENFIKIGMTSRTTQERMLKIPYEYEILKEFKGSALFVYDKEIELHQLCSKFKYNSIKDFDGNRECYSIDIQQLLQ